MFNSNNWKEAIYKDDLKSVILNGIIFSILGGILAGALDYLTNMLNVPISFGLIIIVLMVSSRIKKSFYTYHILYPVLGIVFLTLGLFVSYFTNYLIIFKGISAFTLFSNPSFYLNFLLDPIYGIIIFFRNGYNVFYLLAGILNLAITIWAYVYCYKLIKGRN